MDKNTDVFLDLVRAGLWETEVRIGYYGEIDWQEIFRLAWEQAVCGLVLAGMEHLKDTEVPQDIALRFAATTLQLEQRNFEMNNFIVSLYDKMRDAGVDFVLIKGQGVAQCYERPMWRTYGDVDLLLNNINYEKGKIMFENLSESLPKEYNYNKEYKVLIDGWSVELHGSLRGGLSTSFNKEADVIHRDICYNCNVRYWNIDGRRIPLPEENDDALLIFSHFVKHFYRGESIVKQICDWCRLLWICRESINESVLKEHIHNMGLMAQWRSFGAFAVEFLGMPSAAMPLYSFNKKWSRKAEKICNIIVQMDKHENNVKSPFLVRKCLSMCRRVNLLLRYSSIFFIHSFRFLPYVIYRGIKTTIDNGLRSRRIITN